MHAERAGRFWNFGGISAQCISKCCPAIILTGLELMRRPTVISRRMCHFGPGVNKLKTAEVTAQILDAQNQPVWCANS